MEMLEAIFTVGLVIAGVFLLWLYTKPVNGGLTIYEVFCLNN